MDQSKVYAPHKNILSAAKRLFSTELCIPFEKGSYAMSSALQMPIYSWEEKQLLVWLFRKVIYKYDRWESQNHRCSLCFQPCFALSILLSYK